MSLLGDLMEEMTELLPDEMLFKEDESKPMSKLPFQLHTPLNIERVANLKRKREKNALILSMAAKVLSGGGGAPATATGNSS